MFKKAVIVVFTLSFLNACGPGLQNLMKNPSQLPELSSDAAAKNAGLNAVELDFFARINALRAQYDLPLLQISPALQTAARSHSEYMNANDSLSHSEPSPNTSSGNRIQNAGGDFGATGENIACGNETAEKTYTQWFNSTAHLRNMLSVNYQYIGIARAGTDAERGSKGCPWYWTTDFGGE